MWEIWPFRYFGPTCVTLSGGEVMLTPKSALSLSLAIHELATNAAKFGAFSTPGGNVDVSWRLIETGGVSLSWRETGGPPVHPPTRKGFGSTLIERALAMETGGKANLEYNREGVVCEVLLPPSSVLSCDETKIAAIVRTPISTAIIDDASPEEYRILIVEDSFLITTILQDMFDDLGWEIIGPAARLEDALTLARDENFDVALLDVNLDGAMSWEVASILKERRIPFIFSTGYGEGGILPASLAGSKIVSKPFQLAVVEQALRDAITVGRV
jgi:CheY-like chemotaxis protein